MEVIRPKWLQHASVGAGGRKSQQDSSIFSLSLDSEGKRLATSGLDCTIRIWSIDPHQEGHHLLSVISRHTGAVLCVRWSPPTLKKSFLASSADDSVVLIWQRNENPYANAAFEAAAAGASLDGSAIPTEAYTVAHRLIGHDSDVNGLEWSSDGRYLASCGMDGRMLVWDVENSFSLVRNLESGGKKPLKGLIWDPLGFYLAAQSNDGSLYIWNCGDWKLQACINSPYAEPEESYTYFSRPSWSPDGQIICLCDSVNQSDSVALLVERDRWTCEQSLVGHESAVQVARFSPRLYRSSGGDEVTFLLVALGCQDGILSLWSSRERRPLGVVSGIFEHAIMDLAWSQDGNRLFIANYDGRVAFINLQKELYNGTALSPLEHATLIGKIEKQRPDSLNLPASISQVALQQQLAKPSEASVELEKKLATTLPSGLLESRLGGGSVNAERTNFPTSIKNEPSIKDGKRRITPQLLQPITPIKSGEESSSIKKESYSVILGKPARKSWLKPCTLKTSLVITSTVREEKLPTMEDFAFEIVNTIATGKDTKGNFAKIYRITTTATGQKQVIWENRVEVPILMGKITLDGHLAVAGNNRSLYVFSPAGRHICPPLTLSANIVSMNVGEKTLCIVLENGLFYLWEIPSFKQLVKDELPPLELSGELVALELSSLSENSFLEFHFVDNSTLVYDIIGCTFFRIEGIKDIELMMDALLNHHQIDLGSRLRRILEIDERELRQKSLAIMEGQIAMYSKMGKVELLQTWLVAYIRRLTMEEDYGKVAEAIDTFGSDYRLGQSTRQVLKALLEQSRAPLIRQLTLRLASSSS